MKRTRKQSSEYDRLLSRARKLPRRDQRRLVSEMTAALAQSDRRKTHSLLELEGLGKEVWEGIDVEQYIKAERDSWER
jgi:hypothetical protein